MDHVQLSGIVEGLALDFEKAWQWQRSTIEELLWTLPPHHFQPSLITDAGCAWVPYEIVWEGVAKRIADFVRALGATFVVYSYGNSPGRRDESVVLLGTDGPTAREAHWSIEHGRFGKRDVTPMRRSKKGNTLNAIPRSEDPTSEIAPWDDRFYLSDVAFELRENRGTSGR
jgi:hypothetical protein